VKSETGNWVRKAEDNLESALVLMRTGHHAPCVFFCEQALELLLKAAWIEHTKEGVPPRTHDLVLLAKGTDLNPPEQHLEFLRELAEQYAPSRYPDVASEFPPGVAERYYNRTVELFSWFRQRLS
jgi:HEPN domain-containing protein